MNGFENLGGGEKQPHGRVVAASGHKLKRAKPSVFDAATVTSGHEERPAAIVGVLLMPPVLHLAFLREADLHTHLSQTLQSS